jgi:hypothetical protein
VRILSMERSVERCDNGGCEQHAVHEIPALMFATGRRVPRAGLLQPSASPMDYQIRWISRSHASI